VDVPWGQVAAKVWGQPGASPLVALHDWRDNAASFDMLAPHLNSPLVAIDLPGHGRSSALPASSQTFAPTNIFTVRYVLRKLGYEQVSLLGHGVGAQLSLLYTGLFPDAVGRLILVDSGHPAPSMALAGQLGPMLDSVLWPKQPEQQVPVALEQLLSTYKGRGLSEEAARVMLQRSARKAEGGYVDASDPLLEKAEFRSLFDKTVATLASKVKCPVLSIEADPQKATAEATQAILTKAAASFEHQKLSSGHHAHLDEPEKVAELLNRFLQ